VLSSNSEIPVTVRLIKKEHCKEHCGWSLKMTVGENVDYFFRLCPTATRMRTETDEKNWTMAKNAVNRSTKIPLDHSSRCLH
jgi:hypothetical protein